MDIVLAFVLTFIMLMAGVYKGVFLAYPLLLGLILFILLAVRRGFTLGQALMMAFKGVRKIVPLIGIFILIGIIIAVWMASGTISCIVYYIISFLNPGYFILFAFITTSLVSFLIGTSFGTVGTVGVALAVLAKSGHVDMNLAAGAIIAGAYFGDRCSSMSSSASLVAAITGTNLYGNMRNMLKTCLLPFLAASLIYWIFSLNHPLSAAVTAMGKEISDKFDVRPVMLLPAAVILVLALLKVDVRVSMLLGILTASAEAILFQHRTVPELLRFAAAGFSLGDGSPVSGIIKGGGIVSMLNTSIVVAISSSYAGLFEGADLLKGVEVIIEKICTRLGLFAAATITSVLTAIFGCSQTFAIILTHQLVKKQYSLANQDKGRLAVDIEDTAVVISPLIPWNIAATVPAAILAVGPGFIPYAFFLYLLPLMNLGLRAAKKGLR